MSARRSWFADRAPIAMALAAAITLAYLPLVGLGFQSEDFLLLHVLGEHPPWGERWFGFASPWLGITIVGFYRPVSTLFFAVERTLFGAAVFPYDAVHLASHILNALLVVGIASRLGTGRRGAFLAGLVFGLFPLSPDAVLFLASFATLFGGTFFLLALFLFLDPAPSRPTWLLFSAAVLAALGSYEATAILPAALALAAMVDPGTHGKRRWFACGGATAALGAYFALRASIFGQPLGGYEETAGILSASRLGSLAWRCFASLTRLAWPLSFDAPRIGRDSLIVGSFVLVVVLALVVNGWSRRSTIALGMAFTGVVLGLAPFAFQPLVPGIGRYAYLSAVPLAIGMGALAGNVVAARPGWWRRTAAVGLAAWAVVWLAALGQIVAAHREARQIAKRATHGLEALLAAHPGSEPCYAAARPRVVRRRQIPYASVLRYGLAESQLPPFGRLDEPRVYPLPEHLSADDAVRILGPAKCVFEWDQGRQSWINHATPLASAPLRAITELDVVLRQSANSLGLPHIEWDGEEVGRHRVAWLAVANDAVFEATASTVPLPAAYLQSMLRFHPREPVYWWVEARGARGELLAVSQVRRLSEDLAQRLRVHPVARR